MAEPFQPKPAPELLLQYEQDYNTIQQRIDELREAGLPPSDFRIYMLEGWQANLLYGINSLKDYLRE